MSFFKNKGPFDINFLLKDTLYSKKDIKRKKCKVKNISILKTAKKNDITFFDNIKYIQDLKNTRASFCFIKENHVKYLDETKTAPIISSNPLLDFILISKKFYPDATKDIFNFKQYKKYKHLNKQGTFIDSSVKIGKNFEIGINSTIKKNVIIGSNVKIGSNCVISNAILEDNVTINDGTVIGKIGFGFKLIEKSLNFIPHIGYVKICRNVYIGSNCSIDRGSFSNTVIGNNTMIDNNVHIAHNVKIGSNCMIAGQVGIAGSTSLGNGCMIGGQAGISGHLQIGDNVHIGGHSGVLDNFPDNSKIIGFPAISMRKFIKRYKK
ncbi:MAG: UDP-3-O-(3-hydroxymyristoyl)glucosamine N-acyltransferase [Pelagibacteraceae bacterium]|nr:UDP-3-O-(3-hydroxymyristoyl)glucosamine N-acyltransferase [Pelagibacteraceae bacterium]MCI5079143.1 UDP-3-O-(3-hydroxymyristoyl)glucosamine N-acyltransferase [Pelagibacteraceae bacterium]